MREKSKKPAWANKGGVSCHAPGLTALEQRTGFEPALPVWKTGVLTVEH